VLGFEVPLAFACGEMVLRNDSLSYCGGRPQRKNDIMRYLKESRTMADVLIRGVEEQTLARLDSQAKMQGISRNTLLKRLVEDSTRVSVAMDSKETLRVFEAMADLSHPEFRERAWR
jgi:hypothetical protein